MSRAACWVYRMLNLNVYIFHFNLGKRFSWDAANLSSRGFTLRSDAMQSCSMYNSERTRKSPWTNDWRRLLVQPPMCTSTPQNWRVEDAVFLFESLSPFLCHPFSAMYNSDRSVSVCVVQTDPVLSKKNRDRRTEARHYTWRLPTRGPWGRGSLFLLYWLGIVCRSSWAHHALLTCFFQSREGTACCFPPSGWPCDFLTERRNSCRQTLELSRACRPKEQR